MEKLTTQNLVIGFGKAGKTLAATLAKHGEQVILAEKDNTMYGGTCINIGCIPSKKLLVEGERRPCGIADEAAFEQAMATKKKLVEALRNANFNKLDGLDNVRVINAEAAFTGPHSVHLTSSAAEYEVEAERIFINTGTLPVRINVPGADGKRIYDSTGFLSAVPSQAGGHCRRGLHLFGVRLYVSGFRQRNHDFGGWRHFPCT